VGGWGEGEDESYLQKWRISYGQVSTVDVNELQFIVGFVVVVVVVVVVVILHPPSRIFIALFAPRTTHRLESSTGLEITCRGD